MLVDEPVEAIDQRLTMEGVLCLVCPDVEAFEVAMEQMSTSYAPWCAPPSTHQRFRGLAISQIIADALRWW